MSFLDGRAIRDWCKQRFQLKDNILKTVETVTENTEEGKSVDALVIKEVFQSVSDGKALLASVITDKGVATDARDTFFVMAENVGKIKAGGEGGGGIASPLGYHITSNAAFLNTQTLNLRFYFPKIGVRKIVIKKITVYARKSSSSAPSRSISIRVYAMKDGASIQVCSLGSVSASGTSNSSKEIENMEIDLSEYDEADYIDFYQYGGSGSVYYYLFSVSGDIELYF